MAGQERVSSATTPLSEQPCGLSLTVCRFVVRNCLRCRLSGGKQIMHAAKATPRAVFDVREMLERQEQKFDERTRTLREQLSNRDEQLIERIERVVRDAASASDKERTQDRERFEQLCLRWELSSKRQRVESGESSSQHPAWEGESPSPLADPEANLLPSSLHSPLFPQQPVSLALPDSMPLLSCSEEGIGVPETSASQESAPGDTEDPALGV